MIAAASTALRQLRRHVPCSRGIALMPAVATNARLIIMQGLTTTTGHHQEHAVTDQAADRDALFLHIGPAGDCWIGPSLYAAKHLEPGYVRSIPLSHRMDVDRLVALVEQDAALAHHIYDHQVIPAAIRQELSMPQMPNQHNDTYQEGVGCGRN